MSEQTAILRNPAIVIIFLFGMFASALMVRPIPVLTDLAQAVGTSPAQMGWVLGVIGLPGLIAPFVGAIADRYGMVRVLVVAGVLAAISSVIPLVATSINHLLVGRLLEGFAFCGITTLGPAVIMRVSSGKAQVSGMALWSASGPTGVAIGLFSSGQAGAVDWRLIYVASTGVSMALTLAAIFVIKPAPRSDGMPQGAGELFRTILAGYGHIQVVRLSLAGLLLVGVGLAFNAIFPLSAVAQGWSRTTTANIMSFGNLLTIPGSILAGTLISRQISRRYLIGGIAVAMCLCGIIMFATALGEVGLALAMFGWFMLYGAALVCLLTMLSGVAEANAEGQAVGTLIQMMSLGKTVMPPLWMAVWFGGGGTYLAIALTVVLFAMVTVFPGLRSKPSTDA